MNHEEHSRKPNWLDGYDELLARVHVMRPWIRRAPERELPVYERTWVHLRAQIRRERLRMFWQRILIALDARAEGHEDVALEMFNVHTGEAAIDVSVAEDSRLYVWRHLLSKPSREPFIIDEDYDYPGSPERPMTEDEMRDERVRRNAAWRSSGLYGPIAGIAWGDRYTRKGSVSTLSTFDAILKSVYTDEAIENLAMQEHPLFAAMKKATDDTLAALAEKLQQQAYASQGLPQHVFMNPETYKALQAELTPAQVKIVESPYAPKDRFYLFTDPAGDLHAGTPGGVIKLTDGPALEEMQALQRYATLDYLKARADNASEEDLEAKRLRIEMINKDIAKSLEYSTAPMGLIVTSEDK